MKYFSGTATYTKDFVAPQGWFKPGAKIILDLGAVKEIAEVSVNGKRWAEFCGSPLTGRM